MQHVIPIIAFIIMTTGLIALVLAMREFTRMLGESADHRLSTKRETVGNVKFHTDAETNADVAAAA
ncbi:MAG: hypothetical protein AB9869_09680 [Verrucomicrobiia bacterium]